jgi:hypothetical protein
MADFVSGIAQGQKFMHYVFSDDLQGEGETKHWGNWGMAFLLPRPCIS